MVLLYRFFNICLVYGTGHSLGNTYVTHSYVPVSMVCISTSLLVCVAVGDSGRQPGKLLGGENQPRSTTDLRAVTSRSVLSAECSERVRCGEERGRLRALVGGEKSARRRRGPGPAWWVNRTAHGRESLCCESQLNHSSRTWITVLRITAESQLTDVNHCAAILYRNCKSKMDVSWITKHKLRQLTWYKNKFVLKIPK